MRSIGSILRFPKVSRAQLEEMQRIRKALEAGRD